MWIIYAILSALFAALTSILAKVGIEGVPSNVATFIRTCVVIVMALVVVFVSGQQKAFLSITSKNLLFLVLSGLATGASWLFYYEALQKGVVKIVAPIDKMSGVLTILFALIFLKEAVNLKTVIGMVLLAAGTLVMVL